MIPPGGSVESSATASKPSLIHECFYITHGVKDSYYSSQPNLNESREIYSKPDGSRWLNRRQANPSLTGLIVRRVVHGEKFDLAKELDAVVITSRDVGLPPEVANELELLWDTMLPGVTKPAEPRYLHTHIPIFDAWVRKDHRVEAGRITTAAYDTPIYRAFVELIKDLRAVCDWDAKFDEPIFKRLPRKIRRLRARLEPQKGARRDSEWVALI